MQRLHSEYALLFNRRHRKVGHVFQGRFGSKVMRDDDHLWTTARTSFAILSTPGCAGSGGMAVEQSQRRVEGAEHVWLDRPRLFEHFGRIEKDRIPSIGP